MKEYGRIGQKRWNGVFSEEFLPELNGLRGIKVYREMASNDDTVGSILFAIKMLIRNVGWSVDPGGPSAKDQQAAQFIEENMDDMSNTWTDTISEILSFLTYGWSFHEIVYKRRMGASRNKQLKSKFSDGLIGWQKLPIRSQDTLYQWEYDDDDNLIGMTQQPPPSYEMLTIPLSKGLLFRTESQKDNPEGRSILRTAYRSWYFKRRIQEIEAIGIERDLAGLPVIYVPEGIHIFDQEDEEARRILAACMTMVKNIRRNEFEGLVLPADYKMELLASAGTRQLDPGAVIQRYSTAIAQTVMADFIMLGHEGVGSFALSADKTELFSTAIGAYLDIICETFNNQAIPQLIDLNGSHFNGLTDYPRLRHGDVDNKDLTSLGSFLKDMVGTGIIIPDESIEDYVRDAANLPERTEIPDGRGADPIREALRRAQIGVPMDDNEEEDQERSSGGRRVNPKDQEAGADEDAGGGTAGSRPRQKKPTRRRTEDEEGF
jgi:phage gp29-like protein